MPGRSSDDEQLWAADKREFVADRRDVIADGRDDLAEVRERSSDARERELDAWERRLEARAAALGVPLDDDEAAVRIGDRAVRAVAGSSRDQARREQQEAAGRRDAATKRRLSEARPTLLALAFAEIAEHLYDASDADDVLRRVAEEAVSTIEGCDHASVTLADRSGYRTAASTHPSATAVDHAQYETSEGPCLDALAAARVYAPAFPDERWPALGARPTESGVQSALALRLSPSPQGGDDIAAGSLNSYGIEPDAFDETAEEIGLVLAAHASVAARAVGQRSTLEGLSHNLQQALMSRDVIGQAKGILMERLKVSPEDAFDILRRSSQRLNVKLREVAQSLTLTGELGQDDTAARQPQV